LSKIQYLPLNHAAIMNAPVFDNRPCAMVLAVLAANLGAQKHDADSRLAHGRARSLVGTTGVCADPSHANPMTCRDQTPPKSHKSHSVGEVGVASAPDGLIPATDRVDGERRRVMVDPDADPASVRGDVINAVRRDLAEVLIDEVM